MSREESQRASAGVALFVALCFLGSWFLAAALRVFELTTWTAAVQIPRQPAHVWTPRPTNQSLH